MKESDYFIVRKCNNTKKDRNKVAAIIWIPDSISRINSNCLLFSEIFDKSTDISIVRNHNLKACLLQCVGSRAQDFLMVQDYFWCSLPVLANGVKDPMMEVFKMILRCFLWSYLSCAFRLKGFKYVKGRDQLSFRFGEIGLHVIHLHISLIGF